MGSLVGCGWRGPVSRGNDDRHKSLLGPAVALVPESHRRSLGGHGALLLDYSMRNRSYRSSGGSGDGSTVLEVTIGRGSGSAVATGYSSLRCSAPKSRWRSMRRRNFAR